MLVNTLMYGYGALAWNQQDNYNQGRLDWLDDVGIWGMLETNMLEIGRTCLIETVCKSREWA